MSTQHTLRRRFEEHGGEYDFITEELIDRNIELQQYLQRSNDEAILFRFDGILEGRREHVQCQNCFEFTVPSYSPEEQQGV